MNAKNRLKEILGGALVSETNRRGLYDLLKEDLAEAIIAELPSMCEVDEDKIANYLMHNKYTNISILDSELMSRAISKANIIKVNSQPKEVGDG